MHRAPEKGIGESFVVTVAFRSQQYTYLLTYYPKSELLCLRRQQKSAKALCIPAVRMSVVR